MKNNQWPSMKIMIIIANGGMKTGVILIIMWKYMA
jgi:hypothetical protein